MKSVPIVAHIIVSWHRAWLDRIDRHERLGLVLAAMLCFLAAACMIFVRHNKSTSL